MEKNEAIQSEKLQTSGDVTPLEQVETVEYDPKEEKKLIRRIDRRLVLTCGFMYCVSLMDRTNLGIAVVGGM